LADQRKLLKSAFALLSESIFKGCAIFPLLLRTGKQMQLRAKIMVAIALGRETFCRLLSFSLAHLAALKSAIAFSGSAIALLDLMQLGSQRHSCLALDHQPANPVLTI
jgi:hypothetical protein